MKDYFLFFLLIVLSYFIPKKKNLLIFGSGDGHEFQGNPKYLFLYLQQQQPEGIEYYWSAKTKEQRNMLTKRQLPFVNIYSFKGFFKLLRAQYLFIEKSALDLYFTGSIFGRFHFIQTWHGTPLKKIRMDEDGAYDKYKKYWKLYKFLRKIKFFSRQKFDFILASSSEVATTFSRAFENPNTLLTGYPRNDVLFNRALSIEDYNRKLNLEKYEKVILYAPTFRDATNTIKPFSEDLTHYNEQLKEKNYLFLVKKHPWQQNINIPGSLSHIKDISDQVDDIQELLTPVDILITDYSSVIFDFMLTGKPIIFYAYDFDNYLNQCRGLYPDYFNDLQGPFAQTVSKLFQLIFSVDHLQNDEAYLTAYQKTCKRYNHFRDGQSSKRLLRHLLPDTPIDTPQLLDNRKGRVG